MSINEEIQRNIINYSLIFKHCEHTVYRSHKTISKMDFEYIGLAKWADRLFLCLFYGHLYWMAAIIECLILVCFYYARSSLFLFFYQYFNHSFFYYKNKFQSSYQIF